MRPALISRSASLCMASASAGVGPLMGWGEVTMYMKRMQNLLFEASGGLPSPRNCPAIWDDERDPSGSTAVLRKFGLGSRGQADLFGPPTNAKGPTAPG